MNIEKLNTSEFFSTKIPINHNYKFLITNSNNFSKKYYQDILVYDLILKQNYTSVMQLPRLEKIVLNTTSKMYVNDRKLILFSLAALELISGQKPQLTYARKSIANFKLRQHQILGCKVILCKNKMYSFLDKFSKILIPRIRENFKRKRRTKHTNLSILSITKKNKFIKNLTHSFGLKNMMIFPELENNFELVDHFKGITITFVLSKSNNSSLILSGFQLPV